MSGFIDTKDLRIADLIAKTGKVTLKDTVRVLLAFETVADYANTPYATILAKDFSQDKPTEEQSAACNRAYSLLKDEVKDAGEEGWLEELRAMD